MKKSVAILFGGVSSEHEISLRSAVFVLEGLNPDKYDIKTVGITKQGAWILYTGPVAQIADGTWEKHPDNVPALLSPDRLTHGLVAFYPGENKVIPLDIVFPVLHGKNGEDGTMQGLLTLSGIPYVGCDTLSSAICMDKAVTHSLLNTAGIEQAHYLWFYADRYSVDATKIETKITARLTFPVFVKPANAGSSVGVSKVTNPAELVAAIEKAAKEDKKIIVEEGIVGQEVECAVLGGRDAIASGVGEIAATATFYDYDDKYVSGTSQTIIPANLSPQIAAEVRRIAVRAYRILGCEGLSRVDFFVTAEGKIILNEINTIPGFTPISMYPKLWLAAGYTAESLIDRLLDTAFDRYQ